MNRTLNETLTKLVLETGGNDWTALLPYALFRVRNSPGPFGLTPFELMFGAPPPIYMSVTDKFSPDVSFSPSSNLLIWLKALETIRKEIWSQLRRTYIAGDTQV